MDQEKNLLLFDLLEGLSEFPLAPCESVPFTAPNCAPFCVIKGVSSPPNSEESEAELEGRKGSILHA